jgi:predicted transcriptional regulator of viral defense system
MLWSHGLGVLSHETALSVHQLSDVDPVKIHMTVPEGFRAKDPALVLHTCQLPEADVEEHEALRVTTLLRTLADVAASDLAQEHINKAVMDALEQGKVTRRSILQRSDKLDDHAALRLERALATALEGNGHV